MIDYDYYYNQYRRVPKNSAATQRDLIDYHSTVTVSSYLWPGIIKRPITTSYIDASKLLGLNERPYSMNGLFPKGKGRPKPSIPCEKKIVIIETLKIHIYIIFFVYRIQVMFYYH
jgi:hypothetical protein